MGGRILTIAMISSMTMSAHAQDIQASLDSAVLSNRGSEIILSGTHRCTAGNQIDIYGFVTQIQGKKIASGYVYPTTGFGDCTGGNTTWTATAEVYGDFIFKSGEAIVDISLYSCAFECTASYEIDTTIKVKR